MPESHSETAITSNTGVFLKSDQGKPIFVGGEELRIKRVMSAHGIMLKRLPWWLRFYRWALAMSSLGSFDGYQGATP